MTAGIFLIIPLFFLFSVKVEKNKVITISKPIVITQARKTPAFYLYQQANNLEKKEEEEEVSASVTTTLLSTEKINSVTLPVQLAEMKLSQSEIGSSVDYGFRIAQTQNKQMPSIVAPAVQEIQRNESLAETKTVLVQPNQSPLKKWATVRGKFEVKDGVGVVDHIVEISRVEEGQVREVGQIDLKAGLYSIDIESPQGELVARIKDRSGILIGMDTQKVINLQSRGQYFEGPFIRVGPPGGVAGNPVIPSGGGQTIADNSSHVGLGRSAPGARNLPNSAVSTKAKNDASGISVSLFSEQNRLEKPKDQFSNISQNSSTISLITDKNENYTNVVSIRQTADTSETPLFTKKWVNGVLSYVSDQMKIEFKSKGAPIIIGRVFSDQKPLAGAKVQIESQPGINPIYLDQFMIPNFKQEETSENGYFMFVGLEAEEYSVVAFQNNKIIGHQMFIADMDSIAYQNILTNTAPRAVLVRSFDAFSGQPVDADIVSSDLEDIIETQAGLASFRTNNSLGISSYVVRTKQNYMPITYVQDSRLDHVHVPLISEDWINKIVEKLEMNPAPASGTIIGFVPNIAEYDMYLISEDYDTKQVVYFDQYGQISKTQVAGGGFILFNVPVGAREVVVQEKKSERIYSQVHFVKNSQTSVSHFSE